MEYTKKMSLRKNIFNIGPESLKEIGFSLRNMYRLDGEDQLSIILEKK